MSSQSRKTILLATDQKQSVLNAYAANQPHPIAYTPYGNRPPAIGLLSLLGFNGELPDPLTGHYHLGKGYREFNPVLMRFNSPDSWSPFGRGGINAYAYCDGEPVLGADPTGHSNIFNSAWKGFKNAFLGRTPGKDRIPETVNKLTTAVPKPPTRTDHLKYAQDFDLETLSEQERRLNYGVKPKKNFPPQAEEIAKNSTTDVSAAKNKKPKHSKAVSQKEHEKLLTERLKTYISSASTEKLLSDSAELNKRMERPGPSRNIQILETINNEILRRLN